MPWEQSCTTPYGALQRRVLYTSALLFPPNGPGANRRPRSGRQVQRLVSRPASAPAPLRRCIRALLCVSASKLLAIRDTEEPSASSESSARYRLEEHRADSSAWPRTSRQRPTTERSESRPRTLGHCWGTWPRSFDAVFVNLGIDSLLKIVRSLEQCVCHRGESGFRCFVRLRGDTQKGKASRL